MLLMIIEVELMFLFSKSSGLQSKHPLPPPPTGLCRGVGSSFGNGFQAVRIRVKDR
jgi:hypothetical protein